MTIRIWSKGDAVDAMRACKDRRIEGYMPERHVKDCDWQIGQLPEEERAKIVAWFAEIVDARTSEGFPPGTMLMHT